MSCLALCSRNDIIANVSVLVAAAGVAYFRPLWPDVLVGGIIAALFLRTAVTVLKESVHEYRDLKSVQLVWRTLESGQRA